MPSLRHRVSHHAIEPERGEQERQGGEGLDQDERESAPLERARQHLAHGPHVEDGLLPAQRRQRVARRRDQPALGNRAPQNHGHRSASAGELMVGKIHLRLRLRVEAEFVHIGDHANDGPRSRGVDQAATEGVFVLEVPPRKGLIDDDCRGGGAAVCIGDGAPAQQPDAERLEIAGQDDAHFLIGTRRAGRRRIALDLEGGVVGHSAERQEVHGSGSGHAGKGAKLLQRFVEECTVTRVLGLGLRCRGPRKRDAEREHLVRTEARVDAQHLGEAAQEEPGARQQHQRHRDLRRHQPAPQPAWMRRRAGG